jgi:hypothetical protein
MTQNMVTVALIVGDPGHEGLQLNEGSLAAAARMIEVHGAATHGRWDAGRRSTVWCFDIERARAADLKDELGLAVTFWRTFQRWDSSAKPLSPRHLTELRSMFLVRALMSSSFTPAGFFTGVRTP